MDDVDRHVGDFGQRDRAMRRLGFGARRPRQRVILRRRLPSASARCTRTSITPPFSACMQIVPPFFPVRSSALKMLRIVEHEDAGIGHEQLERRDALPDQRVHLAFHLIVQLGDDHVEAVVDDGLALGLLRPRLPSRGAASVRDTESRSRRSTSCRRTRRRSCRSRSRRPTSCRRTACRGACARRCRRAARSLPAASIVLSACNVDRGADQRDLLVFDQHITRY